MHAVSSPTHQNTNIFSPPGGLIHLILNSEPALPSSLCEIEIQAVLSLYFLFLFCAAIWPHDARTHSSKWRSFVCLTGRRLSPPLAGPRAALIHLSPYVLRYFTQSQSGMGVFGGWRALGKPSPKWLLTPAVICCVTVRWFLALMSCYPSQSHMKPWTAQSESFKMCWGKKKKKKTHHILMTMH